MPFKSQAQRRKFYWMESAGKLAPGTAKEWEKHTPKGKKLPQHVSDKKKENEKKAFVAAFFLKCAAAGITDPERIAEAAEALVTKQAFLTETLGQALGGLTGAAVIPPLVGLAAAPVGGYMAGHVAGQLKNKTDEDDVKTMRLAAVANAYRRRTAEAKTQAEVRKITASDPSRYVVLN